MMISKLNNKYYGFNTSSLIDTVYALLTREGWKVINDKILEFLDILAFTKISLFLLK